MSPLLNWTDRNDANNDFLNLLFCILCMKLHTYEKYKLKYLE